MRNHENPLTESVITDVSLFAENNQIQLKKSVFCQFNNNANHVCTNRKCFKSAIICEIKDCQCRREHEFCYELKLESLLKNLQNKQVFVESLETCINDGVEEIIDMLFTYREEAIAKMKKDFEFFGLSQNEKDFIKEVKDGKCENMTGCKIWQMISSDGKHEKIISMVEETCEFLKSEFEKSNKFFEETVENTNTMIEQLKIETEKFLMETEVPKCMIKKGDILHHEKLEIHESKIMTSLNEFKLIESFFAPRIFKSVKLLYRASENDFELKKFHEKCEDIPDTLTLVETEFGKKIGGLHSHEMEQFKLCLEK